jgi:hypothetical protein
MKNTVVKLPFVFLLIGIFFATFSTIVFAQYTVSGSVYIDTNKNQVKDAGESFTGNISISPVPAAGTTVSTPPGTGTYTISNMGAGPNSVVFPVPTGYSALYPRPSQYGGLTLGPGCNTNGAIGASCSGNNITNLNFGITNSISWLQATGGDVRIDNGFTNNVPAPPPALYTVVDSLNGVTGVVFSGNGAANFCTPGPCTNRSSTKQWVADGTQTPLFTAQTRTSYTYMSKAITDNFITPLALDASICGVGPTCNLATGVIQKGVYQSSGNITLGGATTYTFPSGSGVYYVFLINGDLRIAQNILVPNGVTATFIASGDIIIDKSVSSPNGIACVAPTVLNDTSTGCNVEGFYSADKNIIIDGNGEAGCLGGGTPDTMVNVAGVLVANANRGSNKFILTRDLCDDNLSYPVVSVTQRVDFLLNAPEFIRYAKYNWKEELPGIVPTAAPTTTPIPTPTSAPITNNLVSYWKLDDNPPKDSVGGNNLTTSGTSLVTGKINNARSFSGASNLSCTHAACGGSTKLGIVGNMSISAWVNSSDPTIVDQVIVSKDTSGGNGFDLKFSGITGKLEARFGGGSVVGSTVLSANSWYYVTAVYNLSTISLYLNGVLDGQLSYSAAVNTGTNDFFIGARTDGLNFQGLIDEVGVWSKALSAPEVKNLYNCRQGNTYPFTTPQQSGLTCGIIAYWKMDNSSISDSLGLYPGTNNGTTSSGGVINAGRNFAGAGQYITVSDNSKLTPNNGALSVSFWARLAATTNDVTISKFDSSSSSNQSWEVQYKGSNNTIVVTINATSGTPATWTFNNAGLTNIYWHHIAFTWDGASVSLYKDGTVRTAPKSGGTPSGSVFDNTAPLIIGDRPNSTAPSTGAIDEVGMWDKVLSAAEITQLFNCGAGNQYPFGPATSPCPAATPTP